MQVPELKEPPAVPDREKLTVPVGGVGDPDPVSVTVAVQVDGLLIATDAGAHTTAVEVVRPITVRVNDCDPVLMLGLWVLSPL